MGADAQLKVGMKVRAKNPIRTYWPITGVTDTDAETGDVGEVIMTYPMLEQVTVQWPKIISDAHPDELEVIQ